MAHEDGATRTLVKGLYLLCNDLGFSSSTMARWSFCMGASWIASALTTRGGSRRRRRHNVFKLAVQIETLMKNELKK